jgi:hypothetical protein
MGDAVRYNKTLALLAAGRKRYSAASGDAVAFEGDGSPLRGLTVGIEPVQAGSGDPSPDNVRPISGWTGVNVWRTGKNLLPAKLDRAPTEVSGVVWSTNLDNEGRLRSFEANGKPSTNAPFNVNAAYYNNSLLLKAGVHYTLSGCPAGGGSNSFRLYRQSFGIEYYDDGAGADFPVQGTDSACDIRMAVYKNFRADGLEFHPMIRITGSPAGYEPYCGDTYTIPFPSEAGTVYGGTMDVLSGVLTVDRANIPSYNGESLPGEWISDRDVYAPGSTPTVGAQVVYTLATPITILLTPTEIATLLGENRIWADTGPVSAAYRSLEDAQRSKLAVLLRNRGRDET